MTYVHEAVAAIQKRFPELDPPLAHLYALLLLVKGTETSNSDVHDAWALWVTPDEPTHHSIVPYEELSPSIQDLDTPYAEGIRELAGTIWPQSRKEDDG